MQKTALLYPNPRQKARNFHRFPLPPLLRYGILCPSKERGWCHDGTGTDAVGQAVRRRRRGPCGGQGPGEKADLALQPDGSHRLDRPDSPPAGAAGASGRGQLDRTQLPLRLWYPHYPGRPRVYQLRLYFPGRGAHHHRRPGPHRPPDGPLHCRTSHRAGGPGHRPGIRPAYHPGGQRLAGRECGGLSRRDHRPEQHHCRGLRGDKEHPAQRHRRRDPCRVLRPITDADRAKWEAAQQEYHFR